MDNEAGLTYFEIGVLIQLGWTLTRLATLSGQPSMSEDAGRVASQKRRRMATAAESGEVIVGGVRGARLSRRLRQADEDEQERHKIENEEKQRWVVVLKGFVEVAGCPSTSYPLEGSWWKKIAEGHISLHLRKRGKTWAIVAKWLEAAFSVAWPQSAQQMVYFVMAAASEGKSAAALERFLTTFTFMEEIADISTGRRLGSDSQLQQVVQDLVTSEHGDASGKVPVECLRVHGGGDGGDRNFRRNATFSQSFGVVQGDALERGRLSGSSESSGEVKLAPPR
eukprot:g201.t1